MASNEAVNGRKLFKDRLRFRTKNRDRTFIMPSRFGLAFGVMALVLFFMAVGYANNLIYIFVFFLISVGFTGIIVTNRNLQDCRFDHIKGQDLFANTAGEVTLSIHNRATRDAWDTEARLQSTKTGSDKVWIGALSYADLRIPFMWGVRGLHPLPRIIFESTFPFGLLRAWKVFKSESEVLIFPELKGQEEFPRESLLGEGVQNQGLFRDHRPYQSADPVGRIDWKASARRQELLVKNFEEPEKPTLHFSWDQSALAGGLEKRISQMALWIDQAEKQGFRYSLSVHHQDVPPGHGLVHWRECLGILALLPKEDFDG